MDPAARKVTLGTRAQDWLGGLNVKPKTQIEYESMLRARILPRFGALSLRRISPAGIRSWLADMTDEGLSPSTVAAARLVLRTMLEVAVDDGLIGRTL